MGKFVFKLQALLNIKLQMEERAKDELGKAVQKLEHEKSILRKIEDEKEECILEFTGGASKGIQVEKLKQYSVYISVLNERIELQKENINFAKDNVDRYRDKLIKVMQEREMLEKLKEKKFSEYMAEQQKLEQKLNDELVSYKYKDISPGD